MFQLLHTECKDAKSRKYCKKVVKRRCKNQYAKNHCKKSCGICPEPNAPSDRGKNDGSLSSCDF